MLLYDEILYYFTLFLFYKRKEIIYARKDIIPGMLFWN